MGFDCARAPWLAPLKDPLTSHDVTIAKKKTDSIYQNQMKSKYMVSNSGPYFNPYWSIEFYLYHIKFWKWTICFWVFLQYFVCWKQIVISKFVYQLRSEYLSTYNKRILMIGLDDVLLNGGAHAKTWFSRPFYFWYILWRLQAQLRWKLHGKANFRHFSGRVLRICAFPRLAELRWNDTANYPGIRLSLFNILVEHFHSGTKWYLSPPHIIF